MAVVTVDAPRPSRCHPKWAQVPENTPYDLGSILLQCRR